MQDEWGGNKGGLFALYGTEEARHRSPGDPRTAHDGKRFEAARKEPETNSTYRSVSEGTWGSRGETRE